MVVNSRERALHRPMLIHWFAVITCLALAMLIIVVRLFSEGKRGEILAYMPISFDRKASRTSLLLYDAESNVSVPILKTDGDSIPFSFGAHGYLALSKKTNGKYQIYVLNSLSGSSSPVRINHDATVDAYPLSWNPDASNLAFLEQDARGNRRIYVWDGMKVTEITPHYSAQSMANYMASVSWSFDGRLAFAATYLDPSSQLSNPTEIYLWDGKKTVDLSQNPMGNDELPTWSSDNRLAFLSQTNGKYAINVWDGISFKGDEPDANSFVNVAPEFTAFYSAPEWTNEGNLVFTGTGPSGGHAQIYLWDAKTITNISQNPTETSGRPQWNTDGRWAFMSFFSAQDKVYVRDAGNRTLLAINGASPAWNSGHFLTFCQFKPPWTLSLWDGHQITKISEGTGIAAQWQNGQGSACYSG